MKRARGRAVRQSRRYLAFALLMAPVPCLAAGCGPARYGPGFGTITGIVAQCTPAEIKATGAAPDPSRFMTVSAKNQSGQTVASQRLPIRTSGARYSMRLLAGTYFINAVSATGENSAGDTLDVPAGKTTEEDIDDGAVGSCLN